MMHCRDSPIPVEDPMGNSGMRKAYIFIATGVGCVALLGVAGARHLQDSINGIQRELQTSEQSLSETRKDLDALRRENRTSRHQFEEQRRFSERLLESASRETDSRMNILEEEFRSNRASTREGLAGLRRSLERDLERIRKEILGPSLQVSARSGVGGGTVIGCRETGPDEYEIFIVTAFHVVEKAVVEKEGKTTFQEVEIRVYDAGGKLADERTAEFLSHHRAKDLALLRMRSSEPWPVVANLASRDTLRAIRVFTPVYAVGCPLGHPPLPSPGEISTLRKEVDGENFWMMNAPTFFGNSGGGIFHRETHELVGISAMICTYDGFVSVPVPHLGIMVSLETVYDWLDGQYLQYVYDPEFTPGLCRKLRREASRPHPPPPIPPFRY